MSIPYRSLQSSKTSTIVSTSVYMYHLHHHHRPHWCRWLTFYCATQIYVVRTCYDNVASWVGGWLAGLLFVTRQYCIRTAKHILKHFWPSEGPIILVSSDSNSKGNPFSRGYIYIHTVSQKNPCDYVFDDNLNSKRPIVIIFGTIIT